MKIFLTNKCNLSCVYCFNNKKKNEPELSEIIKKINLAKNNVWLKGGEPFLRKDFLKILKYAKSRKLKTIVETTGILLKKKFLKYIDTIYFVFDTVNFRDWKKITMKGKREYNKTLKSIKLAKKQEKEVYIDSLLTKLSYPSLIKTYKFCRKNNLILRILENPSVPGFDYNDTINLPLSKAKELLGKNENLIYIKAPKSKNRYKTRYFQDRKKYFKKNFIKISRRK